MGSATLRVDYLAWVCPCSRWDSVGFIQPPTLKENRVESTRGHKSEGVALRSLCGGGNAQGVAPCGVARSSRSLTEICLYPGLGLGFKIGSPDKNPLDVQAEARPCA